MSRDTLSDVLRTVRLRGAVFFYVTGGREWAAESPPSREIAASIMPGAEHVMQYHVLIEGSCWAGVVGEPPRRLGAGDIVVFPHGDAHAMSSAPELRPEGDGLAFYRENAGQKFPVRISYEGLEGPHFTPPGARGDTTLVCGFLGCDAAPFNPLLANLPRMLHLRGTDDSAWIAHFLRKAAAESEAGHPGGEAMLARMSEMLFVDAVRRYVDGLPAEGTGWLAGLRDRFVGRALALLHERPAHDWSIDDLGREVGLSRSALHERFVQYVGQAPMQYLAQWRMQVASGLLRSSHATVASIALEVGYDSEAAFARAFKRLVGMPPAAWRRAHSTAAPRLEASPA